jgi:hypothetical protein
MLRENLSRCATLRKNANERQETEKAPFLVVKRIRETIFDEVFKPGDLFSGELEPRFTDWLKDASGAGTRPRPAPQRIGSE